MTRKNNLKPVAAAVGTALVGSLSAMNLASAAENPFRASQLESGYMQVASSHEGEAKEMKEGKCGGDKEMQEGKCGEGKCGGDMKMKEGESGEDKGMKEGKCGEGKCGGDMEKKG